MTPWPKMKSAFLSAGRGLATAALWVGKNAAAAFRAADPDLRRHVAQLPLVGLTLLVPSRTEVEPLPDDGHRPVVFVPGLGGGPGNFLPMRLFFRLMGRSRTYALEYDSTESLEAMAERLGQFVEEVVERNGLPADVQVDVVAHSLGGLVARMALEDERFRARVATVITLGAPHAGSHLARYGATPYWRNLRPDSDALARLARQLPWRGPPQQPRLICLWSEADVLLLPACSARVEGAENVEVPGFTHYSYLVHPEGWRRTFTALGGS